MVDKFLRVSDDALYSCEGVDCPQRVDGVLRTATAKKQNFCSIARDVETSRYTQTEPLSSRMLAGETVRHNDDGSPGYPQWCVLT